MALRKRESASELLRYILPWALNFNNSLVVELLKIEWADSVGSKAFTTKGLQEMFCQVIDSKISLDCL